MYKIHAYESNVYARKSMIAGNYAGIQISFPPGFKMGVDNKAEDFLKKNPAGQVPMMDTPDGPLFESNAMAKYIARKGSDKGLYGTNEYQASLIDQWIDFWSTHFQDSTWTVMGMIRGFRPYDPVLLNQVSATLETKLALVEKHLETHEYFVGNRVTLADIIIWVSFHGLASAFMVPSLISKFPNFKKWFDRCASLKEFADVLPFEWPKKAPQFSNSQQSSTALFLLGIGAIILMHMVR